MAFTCLCSASICHDKTCQSDFGCYNAFNKHLSLSLFGCLNESIKTASFCSNSTNVIVRCCHFDRCALNLTEIAYSPVLSDGSRSTNGFDYYGMSVRVVLPLCLLVTAIVVGCLVVMNKYHNNLTKYLKIYSNLTLVTEANTTPPSFLRPSIDSCSIQEDNGSRFVDNYSGILPLVAGGGAMDVPLPRTTMLQCDSCTSGSGSGMPFLVQRTIARQVQLISAIGKGRFGEVWKGAYYGELVAVKIFSSRDETSWARETHIYNTFLLRHPNILGYYASDMVSRFGCTQLWLITHYHELGSLYDYLHSAVVSLRDCLRLAHSIAAGLSHLHHEIVSGPQGKPAIAHRDLKSKNILIVCPGEACIGDLGLSVIQYSTTAGCGCPALPMASKHKVGTRRYMAPEILADCICPDLDGSANSDVTFSNQSNSSHPHQHHPHNSHNQYHQKSCPIKFEHFLTADIYAFALILWEIVTRCILPGVTVPPADYKVPYHDVVPLDPSTAEMRQLVVVDKVRPALPVTDIRIVEDLFSVMCEGWADKAQTRPTALRLKKNLKSLLMAAGNLC